MIASFIDFSTRFFFFVYFILFFSLIHAFLPKILFSCFSFVYYIEENRERNGEEMIRRDSERARERDFFFCKPIFFSYPARVLDNQS